MKIMHGQMKALKLVTLRKSNGLIIKIMILAIDNKQDILSGIDQIIINNEDSSITKIMKASNPTFLLLKISFRRL